MDERMSAAEVIDGPWRTLADVPRSINFVYDNQARLWEREGNDWVTYGSFIQRLNTAVTDLSGWGPFTLLAPVSPDGEQ